jgi:hypothetical protein
MIKLFCSLCGRVILDRQVFIRPLVKEAVDKDAGLLQVRVKSSKRGLCFRGKNVYGFIGLIRNLAEDSSGLTRRHYATDGHNR